MLKDKLRNLREKAGIKQETVALACSVDRATVSKWESGEFAPRTEKLPALAKILQCSLDELLL